jgi:hypothetical protein
METNTLTESRSWFRLFGKDNLAVPLTLLKVQNLCSHNSIAFLLVAPFLPFSCLWYQPFSMTFLSETRALLQSAEGGKIQFQSP